MAPERRDPLTLNPKQHREQHVIAHAKRLIAEGRALRKRSRDLVQQVDQLTETFKRNHPEQ